VTTTVTPLNKAQLLQWVSGARLFWTERTLDKMPRIGPFCITANLFSDFGR
jgi:hypothetical protein